MFQGCSESLTQCNLQNISQESRHRCNTCFPRIIWLGSSIFCSKINTEKSDRERQVSYDYHLYWNRKYDTNELIYNNRNRLTDTENKLTVSKGAKGRERN